VGRGGEGGLYRDLEMGFFGLLGVGGEVRGSLFLERRVRGCDGVKGKERRR
jgi:hypothetical protein